MFPWQSGSDGREETQRVHLNPQSGRWLPDQSHRQRHVNSAVTRTHPAGGQRIMLALEPQEAAKVIDELPSGADDHYRNVVGSRTPLTARRFRRLQGWRLRRPPATTRDRSVLYNPVPPPRSRVGRFYRPHIGDGAGLDDSRRRADNLQGDQLDELTPAESRQAVSYAKEFAEGEVEAAKALLADTSRCPLGVRCESCGSEGAGLAVTTAETEAGVPCLTQCPRCAEALMPPPVAVTTAARLASQHCAHVGLEVQP